MALTLSIKREDVWPPYPGFETEIKKYTDKIDYITSAKILNGFDYAYTDKEGKTTTYHFSYKNDDQQNFSTQNEMALLVANNTITQLQLQLSEVTKELAQAINGNSTLETLASKVVERNLSPFGFGRNTSDITTTEAFTTNWQGHTTEGETVTLEFDFAQFIDFTVAAGQHKQNTIAEGWMHKTKFRACKNDTELKAYSKEIDLDHMCVEAREMYERVGITPAVTY